MKTSTGRAVKNARMRGVDTMAITPRRLLTPERRAAASAVETVRRAAEKVHSASK